VGDRRGFLRRPAVEARPLAAAGKPAATNPREGGNAAQSSEVLLAPLPDERKPANATLTKGRISRCLAGAFSKTSSWFCAQQQSVSADWTALSAACVPILLD